MISLVDRHILGQWLKTFIPTLLVIVTLLVIADIQNDLNELLEFGASTSEIIEYYLVLTPSFLPVILPISLLISLLFVLGKLHRNLEIVAMRAAGLGLWRITRTLWIGGASLAALLFWLNAEIVPWSAETSKVMWNNFNYRNQLEQETEKSEIGLVYNLTFHHPESQRLWFINRFSEYDYRAFGVTVSVFDQENREIRRILATEGYYDDILGYWRFLDGRDVMFDEEGDAIRSLPFKQLDQPEMNEDPTLMQFLKKRPKDLSFNQLARVIEALSAGEDPKTDRYKIRYYMMLMNPISCFFVVGIAVPFALSGVRTNPVVGVSKSAGFFILYYIITNASGMIGGTFLSPAVAALIPNLSMVAAAVFYTARSVRPA